MNKGGQRDEVVRPEVGFGPARGAEGAGALAVHHLERRQPRASVHLQITANRRRFHERFSDAFLMSEVPLYTMVSA